MSTAYSSKQAISAALLLAWSIAIPSAQAGLNFSHRGEALEDDPSTPLCVPVHPWFPVNQEPRELLDLRIASFANFSAAEVRDMCDRKEVPSLNGKIFDYNAVVSSCGYLGEPFSWITQRLIDIAAASRGAGVVILSTEEIWKRPFLASMVDPGIDFSRAQDLFYVHCGYMKGGLGKGHANLGGSGKIRGVPFREVRVDLVVDSNPWLEFFSSPIYTLVFSVALPVSCLAVCCAAADFLRTLHVATKRRAGQQKSQTKLASYGLNTVHVSLATEVIVMLLLAIYFFFDGHFARRSPFTYHAILMSFLSGMSFYTTFLTAVFWEDLKALTVKMRRVKGGSALARNRNKIVAVFVICLLNDLAPPVALLFNITGFEMILGGVLVVGQLVICVYFTKEVRSAILYVTNAMSTLGKTSKKGGTTESLKRMYRVAKWLGLSVACMASL